MAHLLGTQKLRALGGSRVILDDINVSVEDGDRIGVLGPNGAGKSTLLDLLAGARQPDHGQIIVRDGLEFAHLSQRDVEDAPTVLEAIHPGRKEHEWAANSRIRDIHDGLLADIALQTPVAHLSGGQRRRVALARVLSQGLIEEKPADVVILDEPTNHLDVEGIAWLARHLSDRFGARAGGAAGALIVVTHDRWFLDAVCSHVWEVIPGVDPGYGRPQIPGRLEIYEGSYAAYILARAERARIAQVTAQKRENLLRKELAWLRRGAPARTSKPRFRIDAAEELIANEPPPRDEVELVRMASARLGKQVLDAEDVTLTFGEGADAIALLDHVTYRFAPGERVGIIGVNGAGKTSLLRLLEGTLEPTSGRIRRGKTVRLATLSQDTRELDDIGHLRVVEAVAEIALSVTIGDKEVTASQLVERIGFTKDRAWTPVADISGGERRRLQFIRLLMSEPNVLLLDEPTNDLDTDTLAAMEDLLDSFAGTIIVVSHDRYLLERVTTHQLALLGDGALRDLPGGVEQYVAERELAKQATTSGSSTDSTEGERGPSDAQTFRDAQRRARRIERTMDKVNHQIVKIEAELGSLSASGQPSDDDLRKMTELSRALSELRAEHEELEVEWLEAAETAERHA